NRTTYGAIILPEQGAMPEVLTAPAANTMVAQLLSGVAQQLNAQMVQKVAAMGLETSAIHVAVTPIVSLSENDPTGAGMTSAAFPLMIGGIIGGAISSIFISGRRNKLSFLGLYPIVASTIIVGVLQSWFGFLQQDFFLNSAAVALSIAATAAFIAGLSNLLGRAGIAIGAAFTFLIANPLSSAAMPWQFIAEPWGAFGQFLVPGASNWMIKSLSYFPATELSQQWWTLAIWALAGLALLAVPKLKK
ncbi:MAG: ABC transporter permease, partial [Micrococcales bacterium]